ncbi:single-stranded-DNA-specific exonuclease RecJ [Candidatus Gottesmanbacteria bacterium RBG_16_52_11]|uniref:Single-stranded-DNA-specific exonuclease RecJ n=1 Tax=Candidatus Gottesmanbacteria bacterium RBG_16_52_11 TaxID=1798374 RepID=A0A1F5YYK0_9BACT|nr:MAG: single-stranded-DNA-specific exonuclease RecJ [Candidatus Gottesmanbacteria bacterium RBG_16_52_11]
MKKWEILKQLKSSKSKGRTTGNNSDESEIISILLQNRGIRTAREIKEYLNPTRPEKFAAGEVGIKSGDLNAAIARLVQAAKNKESVVVYADYDADGITAGAVMWEALYAAGINAMPYIPHRVDEGYGLSKKGIAQISSEYKPTLIVTVDHGITGHVQVAYARGLGIDVIVTDHHVKPEHLPDSIIVHTTLLSGAGVAWYTVKELYRHLKLGSDQVTGDFLGMAAIGTIADMVPLTGINRSIVKFGLEWLNLTRRVGIRALIDEAGLAQGRLGTYDISHVLTPRLNAMGRLVHAMDALRLLCTKNAAKAAELAGVLGLTNRERQQLTTDTALHAVESVRSAGTYLSKKLLFVSDESYNQGIIGLVAGRLVDEYYLPAVVLSRGPDISKASARSVTGFNIVEAIRTCSDILVDVGGHPMAAGFTVETKNIDTLRQRLEELADRTLDADTLSRHLRIDMGIPLSAVTDTLWQKLRDFEPFGMGNPEPLFATVNLRIADVRKVGTDGRHLKLSVDDGSRVIDAIAFGFGGLYGSMEPGNSMDLAYTLDMNEWNGFRKLQLKVKDIRLT